MRTFWSYKHDAKDIGLGQDMISGGQPLAGKAGIGMMSGSRDSVTVPILGKGLIKKQVEQRQTI